jgi:hypothetical protein
MTDHPAALDCLLDCAADDLPTDVVDTAQAIGLDDAQNLIAARRLALRQVRRG